MRSKRRAWAVMLVTLLAGIVAAINSFKVPPVLPTLMSELDVDMVTGGWLMSASSLAGIILAIPAAFLLAGLGPRISGLVALACTLIGTTVGGLATTAATMLFGRVIEGIGLSLIAIVAPAVISMWFEPRERGLPMGLWAAWAPAGNVIMFNVAHPLLASFGWRAVWWLGALLTVVALVVYGLVVSAPPRLEQRAPTAPSSLGRRLRNPSSWLLALAFGTFSFSLIGYNTWAPAFLTDTLDVDPARASFYASLMFLAAIPSNVTAGWVLGRMKNHYALLPAAFVATSILLLWSFRLGSVSVVAPYMIALGFASNFVPTATFTFAPETMPSIEFAGLALAIVTIGSNSGSLTSPPFLGSIFSDGNWAAGSGFLAFATGIGTIAAWFVARRLRAT